MRQVAIVSGQHLVIVPSLNSLLLEEFLQEQNFVALPQAMHFGTLNIISVSLREELL